MSNYPVTFGTIYTLPTNAVSYNVHNNMQHSSWYPNLASNYNTFTIPAGTTYILENTVPNDPSLVRFPYFSTTSNPVITDWHVWPNSFTGSTPVPSYPAAVGFGNGQKFWNFKMQMEINGSRGGGNIGDERYNFPSIIAGNGITALYNSNTYGTITEYIIMFY